MNKITTVKQTRHRLSYNKLTQFDGTVQRKGKAFYKPISFLIVFCQGLYICLYCFIYRIVMSYIWLHYINWKNPKDKQTLRIYCIVNLMQSWRSVFLLLRPCSVAFFRAFFLSFLAVFQSLELSTSRSFPVSVEPSSPNFM